MNKLASILILILMATSCQEGQESKSDEIISSSIVGGEYVLEDKLPQVVGISNRNRTVCSGTLIAKNKILTAAHCFSFTPSLKIAYDVNKSLIEKSLNNNTTLEEEFNAHLKDTLDRDARSYRVFTGNGVKGGYVGIKGIKRYVIESIQISTKEYDSYKYAIMNGELYPRTFMEQFSEDWAIVTIKESIDHITPSPLLSNEKVIDSLSNSMPILVAGYGQEASDQMLSEQLEVQQNAARECKKNASTCVNLAKESLILKGLRKLKVESGLKKSNTLEVFSIDIDSVNHLLTLKDNKVLSGLCFGDSGGPSFVNIDGKLQLIGVNVAVSKCGELSFTGIHSTETTSLEKSKIFTFKKLDPRE